MRTYIFILVLLIDYNDSLLKYEIETLISDYEQEWIISSIFLQTHTKLHIETIVYQSQNQLKIFEKSNYTHIVVFIVCRTNKFVYVLLVCYHVNSTNYLFAITHFRYESPIFIHTVLSQMHIPHIAVSMIRNATLNSYTLQMQTSSEQMSMAIRDIVDYFDWGYNHNKILFVYEKHTSNRFYLLNNLSSYMLSSFSKGLDLLSDILRIKKDRQPAVILKALTTDAQRSTKTRAILAEIRDKTDGNKKLIIAVSQKSLDQFLNDVRQKFISFDTCNA